MTEKNSVKVIIYGEEYPIRGDGDIDYIKKIADYVDGRMQEVATKSYHKSAKDVAVLTALNIASDLFELKEKEKQLSLMTGKTQSLLERLEAEIQPSVSS